MGPSPPLQNIWEITDGLWAKIQPVLSTADPPKATGRKRVDQRRMLDGVVYKMRSGCQWNSLPKELGDDSTIHRAYQRWTRLGVFDQIWAMVEESQGSGGTPAKVNGRTAPTEVPEIERTQAGSGQSRRAG